MKIIYIGSSNSLSIIPFQALITSNQHEICALAFDDDLNSNFNVITSNTIQSLAINNSIPLIKFNKDYTNIQSQLRTLQPDVILVSCYARKLPLSLLSIAKIGSFNIHPSLLPSYRGPSPLFWQFRDGIDEFGVTIHRMDEGFDTGNIVSQKKIKIPDNLSIIEATGLLAETASELALDTLYDIKNNSPFERAQNNLTSSYQSFPSPNDYSVSVLWPAKRIFNFIRAYKEKEVSFLCEIDGKSYRLIDVYSYHNEPYKGISGNVFMQEEDEIVFSCQDGVIRCKIIQDK